MSTITSGVLKRALEEASKSEHKVHIGAVIFKGSAIISSGRNSIRSSNIHPKYLKWENSLHAEQNAILRAKDWNKLKGCSICVIRTSKTGVLGMAFPCAMCFELIKHVGIKHIFYSNEAGEIVKYTC